MLVRQGNARDVSSDRWLACTLACVAGAVNAAAFTSLGFFSANMTGNVSAVSDHLALGQLRPASTYAAVVFAFIFGALNSTLMISSGNRRGYTGIYALVILLESIGMVAVTLTQFFLPPGLRDTSMIFGLAYLMGLQNAVVTRISDARVRTTHVSGMATDIGIEVGLLIDAVTAPRPTIEIAAVKARLSLHAQTIMAFLIGGVAGVVIYRHINGGIFLVAAAILAAISIRSLYRSKRLAADVPEVQENDL